MPVYGNMYICPHKWREWAESGGRAFYRNCWRLQCRSRRDVVQRILNAETRRMKEKDKQKLLRNMHVLEAIAELGEE